LERQLSFVADKVGVGVSKEETYRLRQLELALKLQNARSAAAISYPRSPGDFFAADRWGERSDDQRSLTETMMAITTLEGHSAGWVQRTRSCALFEAGFA